MLSKKILIVDDLHEIFLEELKKGDFIVDYKPDITKEEILNIIDQYHGLVIRSKMFIDKAFLDKAIQLEFVARAGAGIDNLDEDALREKGVVIFNAPEGNRDAVGEHAIGMLLMMFNNLNKGHDEVINGKWDRESNRGLELGNQTVGIYGYGNTGRSLAKKLSGFGCRIIAFDKYKSFADDEYAQQVDIDTFKADSDVISIHVPLTDETNLCIGKKFYESLKKSVYIINTSRGKVLCLEDLFWAVENGIVKGACLDVLENEKFPTYTMTEKAVFDQLKSTNKVIFTPHVAGWTFESYRKISEVLSRKVLMHYLTASKLA